ncbi:M23 family peptidase [Aphanothece hegewaldii CCALA 016]|uniref:M23 family peptidase n=1 Tax=Aphanothece hegewaldii CCALA 016 TaxID=2107694 RepID=A0A2T1M0X8_9CHRO|nr:peptidoglycan DD-metalloendopeptidase family protein [Aphanothece hegewaldii]PSF38332.1 M23 family peptidase [Aphanothece hegewaldii CCALA 016]
MYQKILSPNLWFSVFGSLGLIGSSLILPTTQTLATTSNVLVIPDNSAPPVSSPVEPVKPVNQPIAPTPKIQPKLAAPKIFKREEVQTSTQLVTPESHQTTRATLAPQNIETGKNQYIDTTNYSKPSYTPPNQVVITERQKGCQTISRNGQLVGGQCAVTAKARPTRVVRNIQPPSNLVATSSVRSYRNVQPIRSNARRFQSNTEVRVAAPRINGVSLAMSPVPPKVISTNTNTINTVALNMGAGSLKIGLEPIPQYQRATRMSPTVTNINQNKRTDLLFPIPIPSAITSAFGWRVHPVSGNTAMHSGTDLGAPMGTPVLAAYPGEVAVADWAGGYGLMVILRHLEGTQESRYAHLSEIYVKPGDRVEQGAVIGRVGSTGLSTGPHLHFEWRHLTEQGWVAVDAGLHLEYALDNLVQSMQLAQATVQPQNNQPQ